MTVIKCNLTFVVEWNPTDVLILTEKAKRGRVHRLPKLRKIELT